MPIVMKLLVLQKLLILVSNGFKMRSSGAGNNANGNKYCYMAFAAEPFVASNGNPATAR